MRTHGDVIVSVLFALPSSRRTAPLSPAAFDRMTNLLVCMYTEGSCLRRETYEWTSSYLMHILAKRLPNASTRVLFTAADLTETAKS